MDPFTRELIKNRPALLRTARRRLQNPDWAEDAVSETLLAALEKRPDFDEHYRLRAWLFGVLRHKLIDQLREQLGDSTWPLHAESAAVDADEMPDPSPHVDPTCRMMDRQFMLALDDQLDLLPFLHRHAFVMRDGLGMDTPEICGRLDISSVHLGVVLHRARRRLRETLAPHHA
jgi:RNA polymerase sigma-70 factor (ECF subfamily)